MINLFADTNDALKYFGKTWDDVQQIRSAIIIDNQKIEKEISKEQFKKIAESKDCSNVCEHLIIVGRNWWFSRGESWWNYYEAENVKAISKCSEDDLRKII